MIIECFQNKKFNILWSAGCMTGIARAMEFLALSLFILEGLGIAFLITIVFATRMFDEFIRNFYWFNFRKCNIYSSSFYICVQPLSYFVVSFTSK